MLSDTLLFFSRLNDAPSPLSPLPPPKYHQMQTTAMSRPHGVQRHVQSGKGSMIGLIDQRHPATFQMTPNPTLMTDIQSAKDQHRPPVQVGQREMQARAAMVLIEDDRPCSADVLCCHHCTLLKLAAPTRKQVNSSSITKRPQMARTWLNARMFHAR